MTGSLLTLVSTVAVLTNYIQEAYAAGKISDHVLTLMDANLVQVFYFQNRQKYFARDREKKKLHPVKILWH
jgi:hypothetical protein